MSLNDLLTPDEVDALLQEVDRGSLSIEDDDTTSDPDAPLYNFSGQEHIVRGSLPTLEMIYEKFSRKLRAVLSALLRRPVTVDLAGVESMRFSDYSSGLPPHCGMHLTKVRPLHGTGLFMLQPTLVYLLVDSFFGGSAADVRLDQRREITPAELRITKGIIDRMSKDFEEAWSSVYPITMEHIRVESNPLFASIAGPADRVILGRFAINLGTTGGELHFVIPYSMIEPIKDLLDTGMLSEHSDLDRHWRENVTETLHEVNLEVKGTLIEAVLPIRKILSLRPGDVIPIDLPDTVPLYLEGALAFRGTFGVARGRNAVKITVQELRRRADRMSAEMLDVAADRATQAPAPDSAESPKGAAMEASRQAALAEAKRALARA